MENKDTRENTAEDYVFSKIKRSMSDDGVISWIYPEEGLEAIRLSKIEALREARYILEGNRDHYKETEKEFCKGLTNAILVLTKQINTLKNK